MKKSESRKRTGTRGRRWSNGKVSDVRRRRSWRRRVTRRRRRRRSHVIGTEYPTASQGSFSLEAMTSLFFSLSSFFPLSLSFFFLYLPGNKKIEISVQCTLTRFSRWIFQDFSRFCSTRFWFLTRGKSTILYFYFYCFE